MYCFSMWPKVQNATCRYYHVPAEGGFALGKISMLTEAVSLSPYLLSYWLGISHYDLVEPKRWVMKTPEFYSLEHSPNLMFVSVTV